MTVCLGCTTQADKKSQSFRKGIAHVAEILKVSPEDLTQVVRLHEWAHALLDLGLEKADRMSVLRIFQPWQAQARGHIY